LPSKAPKNKSDLSLHGILLAGLRRRQSESFYLFSWQQHSIQRMEIEEFRVSNCYENMALPGVAWVQIEPSAVEVDGCFEVLGVAEAAGHALDLLNLAIESLTHRVGHWVLVGGHDVVDVPANRLRRLPNGF
jgi:hypothetical protein